MTCQIGVLINQSSFRVKFRSQDQSRTAQSHKNALKCGQTWERANRPDLERILSYRRQHKSVTNFIGRF